jgi:hypothetical protein
MTVPLYTLDDLSSRARLDAGHAKPARLAVIGYPVAHSLSPRMHQPALDEAGIDARYIKLEVEPGQVDQAFARMRELGFIGCNVTVPHKFEALAACDEVDPGAREMGAVNTVVFRDDLVTGFNTDGYGFEEAVRETLGLNLAGSTVLIVGAGGGAGGAIATHCAARGVARLVLANRSLDKIEELANRLHRYRGVAREHLLARPEGGGPIAASSRLLQGQPGSLRYHLPSRHGLPGSGEGGGCQGRHRPSHASPPRGESLPALVPRQRSRGRHAPRSGSRRKQLGLPGLHRRARNLQPMGGQ